MLLFELAKLLGVFGEFGLADGGHFPDVDARGKMRHRSSSLSPPRFLEGNKLHI